MTNCSQRAARRTAPTHKADGREFFWSAGPRRPATCELRPANPNLLSHMDAGGLAADGDALHGPVFYGRTGAVPASAVWIGPNRQQYGAGSLQDENELPFIEVPQKS